MIKIKITGRAAEDFRGDLIIPETREKHQVQTHRSVVYLMILIRVNIY